MRGCAAAGATVFGPDDVDFAYFPNGLKPDRIDVMEAAVCEGLRSWVRKPRTPRVGEAAR